MGDDWKPRAGAVVLIEPGGSSGSDVDAPPLTAVAVADPDGRVLLDVGASPAPAATEFDGVASVFAADRFYRVTGVLRLAELDRPGLYELVAKDVENIERRASLRRAIEVPASLTAFDGPGDVVSTLGHTVDLSSGGCRVVTTQPFPIESQPTISLKLEGSTVLARASILERTLVPEGFHYRLVFTDIDLDDRVRIAELVAA